MIPPGNRPARVERPVVWVVGASQGIGAEIARQFASIGCIVCLSSRSRSLLLKVQRNITTLGGHAAVYPCDVTRIKSVQRTYAAICDDHGQIDVLVNSAGITVFSDFLHTSNKMVEGIVDTNLRGPIYCTKCVLPAMSKRRHGWIFNILSNAAVKSFENSAIYTATKAGLFGFSRVLREETRRMNVKVVNVIPGATETSMWSREQLKRYRHRMMSARSVAEAVLSVYQMPPDVVVDEILLRPMLGDVD